MQGMGGIVKDGGLEAYEGRVWDGMAEDEDVDGELLDTEWYRGRGWQGCWRCYQGKG